MNKEYDAENLDMVDRAEIISNIFLVNTITEKSIQIIENEDMDFNYFRKKFFTGLLMLNEYVDMIHGTDDATIEVFDKNSNLYPMFVEILVSITVLKSDTDKELINLLIYELRKFLKKNGDIQLYTGYLTIKDDVVLLHKPENKEPEPEPIIY